MLIMSQFARRMSVPGCRGRSFEQWTASGGLDAADCSTAWRYVMLAKHIAPVFDLDIDAALKAFMDECRSVSLDSLA